MMTRNGFLSKCRCTCVKCLLPSKTEASVAHKARSGERSETISSDPNPLFNNQDNLLASINPELAYNQ